ncbi:hypothetical protein HDV05_001727 [Chytridiales sp. JEL 0842]|nr:hypothetical protein HDV05_001727 [Chytridiales sp. JEL 0842]
MPPHKHIPLIKFLGPRHLLRHTTPTATPTIPSSHSTTPNPTPVRKGNVNILYYTSAKDLPRSFRKQAMSEREMMMVDLGGVPWEPPVESKKKK